ncbi:MAG: 4Fe-4S binding protein [Spirochaetaceae bacterium]|nr:4Fe-4S binding protein [Spirochaetaceae bacterium]
MSASNAKTRKSNRALRAAVLALSLALVTAAGLLHQFGGVKPVGVDALCPFGGLESAYALLAGGSLLAKIAWSSFFVLAAVLAAALVLRRSFCGGLCPLGALQDGFGFLGKKILGKRLELPKRLDGTARYLKYLVLALVLVLTFALGELVIRPYDPWAAYQHLFSAELLTGFLVGLLVLVVSLAGSFFYERFFCKYLCPMGAALTPFSKLGLFKIKRDAAACVDCGLCDKACPANIKVSALETVTSAECLDCDACVNACPVKNTLVIEGPRGRRIGPKGRVAILVAVFALVIGGATVAGGFTWTVKSIEQEVEAAGGIAFFDASAIKGSDTWAGVAEATGIPKEAFAERFKLDPARLGEQLKVAAHAPGSGFEVEAVREFVREKLGK